jgi:hypothetical protein
MQNFNWETEESHSNNIETMSDYLENHLPSKYHIVNQDGTYAEIQSEENAEIYAVHASGNGDFTHHSVRFEKLS